VAGNGTLGYNGDAGPATGAEFNYPIGVAFDASGNLYIADIKNNRIRKVTGVAVSTTASAG
jgi:DNA-binding beta-propeller fold protein YncE